MKDLLLSLAHDCFTYMNPALANQAEFQQSLDTVIKVKAGDNVQFSFDVKLDKLIKDKLSSHFMRIFSEESGWFSTVETYDYICVYDPFCNSSLASRTFREAAMGISVFKADYSWVASLVLDYQTGLVGLADEQGFSTYLAQNGASIAPKSKTAASINDAWVVMTLENRQERIGMATYFPLLQKIGRLVVSSGHIYWLKLATGQIDAYLDPVGGEKLYEMFAATLVQKAGGVVTDTKGTPFDAGAMLKQFIADGEYIYHPVAARTKSLHHELLQVTAH